jgi:hypothetical protein
VRFEVQHSVRLKVSIDNASDNVHQRIHLSFPYQAADCTSRQVVFDVGGLHSRQAKDLVTKNHRLTCVNFCPSQAIGLWTNFRQAHLSAQCTSPLAISFPELKKEKAVGFL